ncbi:MAG: helix-turn-helix transcriptional regulator [Phototrophicaceae bacterium]
MDFKDISARMKQARGTDDAEEQPYDFGESYRIRSKMLGVLIRDARLNAARTVEDCARLLNVANTVIESWEFGDTAPTLPQLELLAYYLDVPVSHFWSMKTMDTDKNEKLASQDEYMALRNRMIGALLRQAREAESLTEEEVAERAQITLELFQKYQMGDTSIPMHHLSVIANIVNKNMDYFLETSSYVGELLRIREQWKHFSDLDPEVREFAANPLNIGFIKIAITFSKMPVDQLRLAAEGMLEIAM